MRYAISHAPAAVAALWQAGCQWLGRDGLADRAVVRPRFSDLDSALFNELTRVPGHYGFQATLAGPFRLKQGRTETELVEALIDFAGRQRPIDLPPLTIARLDDFFCLRPVRHSQPVQVLASLCVRHFDRFRAPLSPSEMARCRAARLNGYERKNLALWGHPYVFEEFRFHYPLTARILDATLAARVQAALHELFASRLDLPLTLDSLCLFVEPEPGRPFRGLHALPFPGPFRQPEDHCDHNPPHLPQNVSSGYQCHPA